MMTDTPDWADEIANKLSRIERGESMEKFFFAQASQIAAALRKAKAAGLREAAEICEKTLIDPTPDVPLLIKAGTIFRASAHDQARVIRASADKLERET